ADSKTWILPRLAHLVPPPPGPRRTVILSAQPEPTNDIVREGWEGVTGWGPTVIGRVRTLIEATQTDVVTPPEPLKKDTLWPRPRIDSKLWPLFAAPLVLSETPLQLPAAPGAGTDDPLHAYVAKALPRVYWTGAFSIADDRHASEALERAATG